MRLLAISLIISILGTLSLLVLSLLLHPQQVSSYSQLETSRLVQVHGKILSVKSFQDFSIIILDNNLTVTCNKCPFKQGQEIEVKGKVSEYQNKKQIDAGTIKVIE